MHAAKPLCPLFILETKKLDKNVNTKYDGMNFSDVRLYNTQTTVSVLPVKLVPGAACRAVSSATVTSGVFARNFSGMLPVLIISSAMTTAVASSYFLLAFSRARCSLCPVGSVSLESKTSLTCQEMWQWREVMAAMRSWQMPDVTGWTRSRGERKSSNWKQFSMQTYSNTVMHIIWNLLAF